MQGVELVMDVEDAFGVSIPDDVAQDVLTAGQLFDLVLGLVRAGGDSALKHRPDLEAFVWSRVCELSAALAWGVRPNEITRETRFVEDLGYG